jgi:hypothetical protein
MKLILIIILCLLSLRLIAPSAKELIIERIQPLKPYDKMVIAFMQVESNFNPLAKGKLDDTGILQIRQIAIDEANRINEITGNEVRYVFIDALDSLKSVNIWYIVQGYWNPSFDIRKATEVWNPGSGELYYNKIKEAQK